MGHINRAKSTHNQSQQPSPSALDSHEKFCNQFIYVTESANRRLQEFKNTWTVLRFPWPYLVPCLTVLGETLKQKGGWPCANALPPHPSLSSLPFTAPCSLSPLQESCSPGTALRSLDICSVCLFSATGRGQEGRVCFL